MYVVMCGWWWQFFCDGRIKKMLEPPPPLTSQCPGRFGLLPPFEKTPRDCNIGCPGHGIFHPSHMIPVVIFMSREPSGVALSLDPSGRVLKWQPIIGTAKQGPAVICSSFTQFSADFCVPSPRRQKWTPYIGSAIES